MTITLPPPPFNQKKIDQAAAIQAEKDKAEAAANIAALTQNRNNNTAPKADKQIIKKKNPVLANLDSDVKKNDLFKRQQERFATGPYAMESQGKSHEEKAVPSSNNIPRPSKQPTHNQNKEVQQNQPPRLRVQPHKSPVDKPLNPQEILAHREAMLDAAKLKRKQQAIKQNNKKLRFVITLFCV